MVCPLPRRVSLNLSAYKVELTRSLNYPSYIEHVIIVRGYTDALGRAFLELVDLAH